MRSWLFSVINTDRDSTIKHVGASKIISSTCHRKQQACAKPHHGKIVLVLAVRSAFGEGRPVPDVSTAVVLPTLARSPASPLVHVPSPGRPQRCRNASVLALGSTQRVSREQGRGLNMLKSHCFFTHSWPFCVINSGRDSTIERVDVSEAISRTGRLEQQTCAKSHHGTIVLMLEQRPASGEWRPVHEDSVVDVLPSHARPLLHPLVLVTPLRCPRPYPNVIILALRSAPRDLRGHSRPRMRNRGCAYLYALARDGAEQSFRMDTFTPFLVLVVLLTLSGTASSKQLPCSPLSHSPCTRPLSSAACSHVRRLWAAHQKAGRARFLGAMKDCCHDDCTVWQPLLGFQAELPIVKRHRRRYMLLSGGRRPLRLERHWPAHLARRGALWGHRGERIGEARNPGPAPSIEPRAACTAPLTRVDDSMMTSMWNFGMSLGSGGFGTVQTCRHPRTGAELAVKSIDKGRFAAFKSRRNSQLECQSECDILSRLQHPNIIRSFASFESHTTVYLIMEHIQGRDLLDVLMQNSALPEDAARRLFRQVAMAIAYMHGQNIVHRDVKPENVMVTASSASLKATLIDFGLARACNAPRGCLTFCGTPLYLAPELIATFRAEPHDPTRGYGMAVDAWSLGVLLYTTLCGVPPFDSDSDTLYDTIRMGHWSFDVPEWQGITVSAKSAVAQLMHIDPETRLDARVALTHLWLDCTSCQHPVLAEGYPLAPPLLAQPTVHARTSRATSDSRPSRVPCPSANVALQDVPPGCSRSDSSRKRTRSSANTEPWQAPRPRVSDRGYPDRSGDAQCRASPGGAKDRTSRDARIHRPPPSLSRTERNATTDPAAIEAVGSDSPDLRPSARALGAPPARRAQCRSASLPLFCILVALRRFARNDVPSVCFHKTCSPPFWTALYHQRAPMVDVLHSAAFALRNVSPEPSAPPCVRRIQGTPAVMQSQATVAEIPPRSPTTPCTRAPDGAFGRKALGRLLILPPRCRALPWDRRSLPCEMATPVGNRPRARGLPALLLALPCRTSERRRLRLELTPRPWPRGRRPPRRQLLRRPADSRMAIAPPRNSRRA